VYYCMTIARNTSLLGEAGVFGPLVEVLKTHLQSAAVMEQACRALGNVADDGEQRRMGDERLRVGIIGDREMKWTK